VKMRRKTTPAEAVAGPRTRPASAIGAATGQPRDLFAAAGDHHLLAHLDQGRQPREPALGLSHVATAVMERSLADPQTGRRRQPVDFNLITPAGR